jgi:hypothetical protein
MPVAPVWAISGRVIRSKGPYQRQLSIMRPPEFRYRARARHSPPDPTVGRCHRTRQPRREPLRKDLAHAEERRHRVRPGRERAEPVGHRVAHVDGLPRFSSVPPT